MKTNAIVRIILFSLVIVILLGILGAGILGASFSFSWNYSGEEQEGFVTYDDLGSPLSVNAADIKELEIEWVAGTITIQPSENADAITIQESEVSDSKYRMLFKQSGDKLTLQFCKENISIVGININVNISKDLVITVPAGWICRELTIDAAAANVDVRDLVMESVEFNGASGICTFDNCTVEELDMETASGDVRFSGALDRMNIEAMSADCELQVTNAPSQIELNTMSGDLELTLPDHCGFTASIDALSSDFNSEFPTSLSNGNHVYGDGSCRISIEAMSGDIFIRKRETEPLPTLPPNGF